MSGDDSHQTAILAHTCIDARNPRLTMTAHRCEMTHRFVVTVFNDGVALFDEHLNDEEICAFGDSACKALLKIKMHLLTKILSKLRKLGLMPT